MNVFAKVVISVDDGMLSMELVFSILQRKVFANTILNVYIFTSEMNKVLVLAEYIEKCCFSNMNGNISIVPVETHHMFIFTVCVIHFRLRSYYFRYLFNLNFITSLGCV